MYFYEASSEAYYSFMRFMPYWYIDIKVVVLAAMAKKLTLIAFSSLILCHSYAKATLS